VAARVTAPSQTDVWLLIVISHLSTEMEGPVPYAQKSEGGEEFVGSVQVHLVSDSPHLLGDLRDWIAPVVVKWAQTKVLALQRAAPPPPTSDEAE